MKFSKSIVILLFFFQLIACSEKKEAEKQVSVKEAVMAKKDTTVAVQTPEEKESFSDFFANFMTDREFQKDRIVFPILIDSDSIRSRVSWSHYRFYSDSSYMPILCVDTLTYFEDKPDLVNINMTIVNFNKKKSNDFDFVKQNNKWFLSKVENKNIKTLKDYDFLYFLARFSSDPNFQLKHVQFPIVTISADPFKDYEVGEEKVHQENWNMLDFMPDLNNIMILDAQENDKNKRYIFLSGIENGIFVNYTFEKISKQWYLTKVEDYSN